MTDIDPFADAVLEGPSEGGLSQLSELFRKRQEVNDRAEELRAELKIVEAELRKIEERDFPDLFDEVGIESFRADGREIAVNSKLYGSLPPNTNPENHNAALAELRRLDGLGVLKAEINMQFPKTEAEVAEALYHQLEENGYPVVLREGAHAGTYKAWAKEKIEEGADLDLDALGLYFRRFITVKEIK